VDIQIADGVSDSCKEYAVKKTSRADLKKKKSLSEERSKHALKLIIKSYSPVPMTARSKALGLRPLAG